MEEDQVWPACRPLVVVHPKAIRQSHCLFLGWARHLQFPSSRSIRGCVSRTLFDLETQISRARTSRQVTGVKASLTANADRNTHTDTNERKPHVRGRTLRFSVESNVSARRASSVGSLRRGYRGAGSPSCATLLAACCSRKAWTCALSWSCSGTAGCTPRRPSARTSSRVAEARGEPVGNRLRLSTATAMLQLEALLGLFSYLGHAGVS